MRSRSWGRPADGGARAAASREPERSEGGRGGRSGEIEEQEERAVDLAQGGGVGLADGVADLGAGDGGQLLDHDLGRALQAGGGRGGDLHPTRSATSRRGRDRADRDAGPSDPIGR